MKRQMLSRFRRDEKGSMTVEAVLIIPILVWAITATFVFWDGFKARNTSQKATYTIADMLSRETAAINDDYMTSVYEIFDYLSGQPGPNAVRVTVVTMVEDPASGLKTMELVWSKAVGDVDPYSDLSVLAGRIPDMATGDQLIIVETERVWAPAFAVGLAAGYRFREVSVTRPRFAPQLVWNGA